LSANPSIKPILSITCTLPLFFGLGVIFTPTGLLLYKAAQSTKEISIVFTDCISTSGQNVEDTFKKGIFNQQLQCIKPFNITDSEDFKGDVNFYYGLDNFFQNHRRYVKSRNDMQLAGNLDSIDDCDPYSTTNTTTGTILPYAPCGAVANSMYNDTFTLSYTNNTFAPLSGQPFTTTSTVVPFTTEGVVWSVETKKKYKNPPLNGLTLCEAFKNTIKPPNWQTAPCNLSDGTSYGFENVDFIVWMNVAALPTFRKLYRRLDRTASPIFKNGLPPGQYQLTINYNYPVQAFEGQKRFIISPERWTGPKNYFLGIAYMSVGAFLLLLSAILLIIYLKQLRDSKNK